MIKTRIVLADDHAIVLEGIKAVLSTYSEIVVVKEAADGEEVLLYLEDNNADVAVLDINMPVLDGLTCARRIKAIYPHMKIIILTMYAQKSFLEQIIKIGVDGCLLKSNTGKELGEAIRRVMAGKSYLDTVQSFMSTPDTGNDLKLSNREVEIIKLLAEGLTSQQIAEKLFIAEQTVKTHRKNIFRKVNVHTTAELIQAALNQRII